MPAKKYTTIQGDTFDIIAKKIYGSEEYMTDLLKANKQYNEYVIFSAGIEITCPVVDAQKLSFLQPPWKR